MTVYHHPKQNRVSWVVTVLEEEFAEIPEFFLYGSYSKLPSEGVWEEQIPYTLDANSDIDLAVQFKHGLRELLILAGWQEKRDMAYQDRQTEYVFGKIVEGEKVQISLRKNLVLFKEAWNSISKEFYWSFINKRSDKFIGPDGVKMYLDQLFWLSQGVWKEAVSTDHNKHITPEVIFRGVQFGRNLPRPLGGLHGIWIDELEEVRIE